MNDQDFKKIFSEHKVEVFDAGFSECVIRQLPKRRNMLPQMVMVVFVLNGLIFTLAVQDVQPLLEQIGHLVTTICYLHIPSLGYVVTYFGIMALLGIIGYSVALG